MLANEMPLAEPRLIDVDRRITKSAVAWGAVVAGAAAAAALSMLLLMLGVGLGLSAASPWAGNGISAKTFGVGTIAWLAFTQLAAAGLGGYLAGRLRTRWLGADSDEVHFRDTAHGFLAWALATLMAAALLSSSIGAMLGTAAELGATVGSGATATAAAGGGAAIASRAANDTPPGGDIDYFVDSLFRQPPVAATTPAVMASAAGVATDTGSHREGAAGAAPEFTRIFARALKNGALSPEDSRYAGEAIAQRTGLSRIDAEKRIADAVQKARTEAQAAETAAREAADAARKASAKVAVWSFIALLIGAFAASLMATFGGRQRDLQT
ncbi:hypothetical protein [Roseateles violae]|uniref:Transmembrane protein n=1 Tax=Roseateles violae TaxID=3058042 RepID=A0ABT8E0E2_9BURK|nr:hypothetical protein [Pelomonas sp. PFR6]MDN3923275.1 hypothetical protein [Pelomonas sp. PFR6]